MLSIGKMAAGQETYYDNLASEDYYLDGGEPPGKWFGQGADALGLSEQVNSEDFADLFQGQLRGERLVQQSTRTRTPGWDLTFSAPKSVSVMFSQADHEESKMLRDAQQVAVEKALSYVEEKCGFTRRGKGGMIVENAKCVFSTFEHGTSRAEQPQLHTHALMINVCVREDGTTGALKTEKLYQHKMAAGAVYRAELAHQLEQTLGVEILRDDFSFKVAGVSEELCDHFSKRRQEIEGKLDELGLSGAKASATAALTTRSIKGSISRQDLIKEWKEVGESFGWSTQQLHEIIGQSHAQPEEIQKNHASLAAIEGVEHLMKSKSFFTEKDAVRFACEFSQGRGVSADQALEATEVALSAEGMVNLGIHDGEKHYTTQAHLDLEAEMMRDVVSLRNGKSIEVLPSAIDAAFQSSAEEGKPLTKEQEMAARHILEDAGKISTIIGDAGTGKTAVLKPVATALTESGYQVRGIALAGKAAEGMQEGSGIESGTIASFLWTQEKIRGGWNEDNAKADFEKWVRDKRDEMPLEEAKDFNPVWTQRAAENAKARFEAIQGKNTLDEKTVLLLDEAGMVDTQQLAQVVAIAKESGAKLVAIGDPKQLQSINQGGGFKGIAEEVEGARLTEIFRQKDSKEKAAVKAMAEGNVRESLNHYAEEGRLRVATDREGAKEELIAEWGKDGILNPSDNLMLAGTNIDVHDLNKRAQDARKQTGELHGESMQVGSSSFYQGDRVLFTRNHKGLGVKNGHLGVVRNFNPNMGMISVELDGEGPAQERTRRISLQDYSDFSLGYAVTTHKSQGTTVKNVLVLTDEAMTDKQMSYVQLSRVEEKATIFSTEEEVGEQLTDLVRTMSRDREKIMALELANRELNEELWRLNTQQEF